MSSKKAPVSSAQLIQQKQEAEARLDSLRQQQVDALEEGRDFPHSSEFVTLNERMAALDKAIARAEAREEEEEKRVAAAADADGLQAKLDKIKDGERVYLDAVKRVAEIMPQVIDALRRIKDIASPMYNSISAATKQGHVPVFDYTNVEMRLARYIGMYLGQVSRAGFYGSMLWPPERDESGEMVAQEFATVTGAVHQAEQLLNQQIAELRRLAAGGADAE